MSGISITRALTELKTLNDRINRTITESVFVDWKVRCQDRNLKKVENATRNLQSVRDMIAQRDRLKRAIVLSNANTKVMVAGKEYTVAEAIEHKHSVSYLTSLLEQMRRQYAAAEQNLETHNKRVQDKLDRLLETEFGKDNVKSNVENIQAITETYLKNQKAEMVDPVGVVEQMDRLAKEIDEFRKEVDLVLSESNAVTRIEV